MNSLTIPIQRTPAPASRGRAWLAPAIAVLSVGTIAAVAASLRRSRRELTDAFGTDTSHRRRSKALARELAAVNADLERAIHVANEARDAAEAREREFRLLDQASQVLASSLDYQTTIASVVRLAVPEYADWAGADLLVDGEIRQLAIAHTDPEREEWGRKLTSASRPPVNGLAGVPYVIRTGEPQLYADTTDEVLVRVAQTPERLQFCREIGSRSIIIVPMSARAKTLGALVLVSTRDDRIYDEHDVAVARELAHRAALAIDNAQLYSAALAANKAKTNFLGTMSHELRTPLTAIIGYEELLSDGITAPVTDAQRNQLDRIRISAMHLLGLIDDVLCFARVEAGHMTLKLEPVDANAIVREAAVVVEPTARLKGLSIDVVTSLAEIVMHTDVSKLRQVIVNLLSNAVKFTERGHIGVEAASSKEGVTFLVRDTGIGIPAEHIEQIFDPFWQVEQNVTRSAGGSGLGLTITRRLVDLLGGEISVDSAVGVGSTFRIELPLVPASRRGGEEDHDDNNR